LVAEKRVQSPGSAALACSGSVLEVLAEGTIRIGDTVILD
jgi:hypothetical protein